MFPHWKVNFVLGGPGAGKGTQCTKFSENYNFGHLSIGDILREEGLKPYSPWKDIIEANMKEGKVRPQHMTTALLKAAMMEMFEKQSVSTFLIDGEPSSNPDQIDH